MSTRLPARSTLSILSLFKAMTLAEDDVNWWKHWKTAWLFGRRKLVVNKLRTATNVIRRSEPAVSESDELRRSICACAINFCAHSAEHDARALISLCVLIWKHMRIRGCSKFYCHALPFETMHQCCESRYIEYRCSKFSSKSPVYRNNWSYSKNTVLAFFYRIIAKLIADDNTIIK